MNTGNMCLGVKSEDGLRAWSAQIQQWTCWGATEQQWTVNWLVNRSWQPYHQLVGKASGLCLDISNAGSGAGQQPLQWGCGAHQPSSAAVDGRSEWEEYAMLGAMRMAVMFAAVTMVLAVAGTAGAVPPGGGGPGGDPGGDPGGGGVDCIVDATVSLTASPSSLPLGTSVVVSWSVSLPSGCRVTASIFGLGFGGGPVTGSGSLTVTPTSLGLTSWRLHLSAPGGTSADPATARVTVVPPPRPAYDPEHCTNHLVACQRGDVNRDGVLDAVGFIDNADINQGWQGRAVVALGNPAHGFLAPTVWSGTGCSTPGVDCQLADVNGDFRADVVEFVKSAIGGSAEGDVLVYLASPNDPLFFTAQKWSDWMCPLAETCELADVTGDGKLDAVAFVKSTRGGADEGDVWVAAQQPGGEFGVATKWSDSACTAAMTCLLGDVNGDGRADAVSLSKSTVAGHAGESWVALANATGTGFLAQQQWSTVANPVCMANESCALVDLDLDGRADIIAKDPNDSRLAQNEAWVAASTATGFAPVTKADLRTAFMPGVNGPHLPITCSGLDREMDVLFAANDFLSVIFDVTHWTVLSPIFDAIAQRLDQDMDQYVQQGCNNAVITTV
jgi:hypothetical protein